MTRAIVIVSGIYTRTGQSELIKVTLNSGDVWSVIKEETYSVTVQKNDTILVLKKSTFNNIFRTENDY